MTTTPCPTPASLPLLKDLEPRAIGQWLADRRQPSFRAAQLLEWAYRRWARSWEDMTTLPRSLRGELAAAFQLFALTVRRRSTAADGTEKFLFELQDGETIETVLLRTPERTTVCISTQVGCPVRCTFCASGGQGLVRDLRPAEIIDQVLFVCGELGQRVDNIVVMGMGEPLLNLGSLVPALDRLCDPALTDFGARHVTISTSGIVPGILELAALRRQWHLALSLHAADEAKRATLIPARHRYPLGEVLAACGRYKELTGRIVTFEYALFAGVNDQEEDADRLAAAARAVAARINLIPCNETGRRFRAPARRAVLQFAEALRSRGVPVTVRRERGADILAACGQLRQAERESGQS